MTSGEIKTASVTHNGRELKYRNVSELKTALSMARAEANREQQIEKLQSGEMSGNRIRMRF